MEHQPEPGQLNKKNFTEEENVKVRILKKNTVKSHHVFVTWSLKSVLIENYYMIMDTPMVLICNAKAMLLELTLVKFTKKFNQTFGLSVMKGVLMILEVIQISISF